METRTCQVVGGKGQGEERLWAGSLEAAQRRLGSAGLWGTPGPEPHPTMERGGLSWDFQRFLG